MMHERRKLIRNMAAGGAALAVAAALAAETQARPNSAPRGTNIELANRDPRFTALYDALHKLETGKIPNRVLGAVVTFSVKQDWYKNGLYFAPADLAYHYTKQPGTKVNRYIGWAPRYMNYKGEEWLAFYDMGLKQDDSPLYTPHEVSQGSATDWRYMSFIRLKSPPKDLKFWYTPGSAVADGKTHAASIDAQDRLTVAGMPEDVPGTMRYYPLQTTLDGVAHSMKRLPNSVVTSLH